MLLRFCSHTRYRCGFTLQLTLDRCSTRCRANRFNRSHENGAKVLQHYPFMAPNRLVYISIESHELHVTSVCTVSKLRLTRLIHNNDTIQGADVQVLLHAMRLDHAHEVFPQEALDEVYTREMKTRYQSLKAALFTLENSARFSTNFLAAHALLALHEIGHGLFPAAYFTVGNLARQFCALGLHDRKKATQILPKPGMNFTKLTSH